MSGISDPCSHVQSRTSADPTSSTSATVVEAAPSSRTNRIKNSSRQSGVSRWRVTSPSGFFEWGYGGSGPAQLALALLLDYTDDEEVALAEYKAFKTEVVSQLECTGP